MTERELDQYRCTECESVVRKKLVHLDFEHPVHGEEMEGPFKRLACECTVFERSSGMYVRFSEDLPDKWIPGSDMNE